jgi:hypothetical protein
MMSRFVMLVFFFSLANCLPTTTPPPTTQDIVQFSRRLYSSLGTKKAADLAHDFQPEYDALNADGKLGETLGALAEMRIEDLTVSVRRAKKMRRVVALLEGV